MSRLRLLDQSRDLCGWAFALAAAGLPLALLAVHLDLGHRGDVRFFYDWYLAFRQGAGFYRDGPGLNYPILGVLAACGPAWCIEKLAGEGALSFEAFWQVHKVFLSLCEIGLVLALAGLGRSLQAEPGSGLRRPRLMALGLYLLPATWAGGAWFGQTDVWTGLWLALGAWGGLRFAQRPRSAGWLALSLTGFHGALLSKQLAVFSLPAIAIAAGVGLARAFRQDGPARGAVLAGACALSFGAFFAADPLVDLPAGFHSHLAFIWLGGGSAHADVLSGGGASIWALLCADPAAPATAPLLGGLSAKAIGLGLYGLVMLAALAWLILRLRRGQGFVSGLLVFAGLSNLAMAVLLTGVHERYLYHGVPFLLLGLHGLARRDALTRSLRWTAWAVCGWSGLFVLGSIHWEAFSGPLVLFRSHIPIGIVELGLLAGLLAWMWMPEEVADDREAQAG
ncbi:MAG: hypothetical protein JXR96_08615 [Deltaproteobacteria bacterium]|nr:hypothetical protein [Deltaproteobacteria bacterium]